MKIKKKEKKEIKHKEAGVIPSLGPRDDSGECEMMLSLLSLVRSPLSITSAKCLFVSLQVGALGVL